jgi:hypothetical protein
VRGSERVVERAVVGFLTVGSGLICLTMIVGGRIAEWAFVLLSLLFPSALILLGGARSGRSTKATALTAVALALLLEGTAVAVLLLSRSADGSWLAGLPTATALLLAGLGVAPLILIVLAYALLGDRSSRDPGGPKVAG